VYLCPDEFSNVELCAKTSAGSFPTLPKRNPIASDPLLVASNVLAAATRLLKMQWYPNEHQEPGHLQWFCIPEAFRTGGGPINHAAFALGDPLLTPNDSWRAVGLRSVNNVGAPWCVITRGRVIRCPTKRQEEVRMLGITC
jgi:hypothetical protein